jgi:hypothetical protein
MQVIVTEADRRRMRKEFRLLMNSIQAFQLFPRKQRNLLAERLLDIAVAEQEGKSPPEFPPEGFEVVFTKIGNEREGVSATLRYDSSSSLGRSDDDTIGSVVEEQSKVDVPVEDKL